jgi:8-oxo-dGTP pyrophosphatase MutT (NUDIX family)
MKAENTGDPTEVLASTANSFGGSVVNPEGLPADPNVFRERLRRSLDAWRGDGLKVVWLEVPIARAQLIPGAVEAGFTFHHAGEDGAMLTRRLEEGAYVPPYASHYIGAGGVVLNGRRELLVVCEKYRRSGRPYYKLPGGALHAGEHLVGGVMREVLEETGIRTRFEALVCFRHWHGYRHGKSDIYFVCRLSPLSEEVCVQAEEIEECRWMPVSEYMASEDVSAFNKRVVRAALENPGVVPVEIEGYADPDRYEFFMPMDGT